MPATHVTAIISPKPGKEARVQELIEAIVKSAETDEPNCKYYFFTKVVDSNDFIVIEKYDSMKAFDFHKDQANFKEFARALQAEDLVSKAPAIMASEKISGFESR